MEIATTFNFILFDEFSKAGMKPVFVGEYFVDPAAPGQTRVFCHQGSEACSPIPIRRGVIGRAVTTGKDQYAPDVTKDKSHVGCDPNMQGSELVLISWSEPYPSGKHEGCRVPLGVLDIDLNIKEALSPPDIAALTKIWEKYGKLIFPGVPKFEPEGQLFVLKK
jgi:putative methionine-R-sulfoxide reductase with GAF domain